MAQRAILAAGINTLTDLRQNLSYDMDWSGTFEFEGGADCMRVCIVGDEDGPSSHQLTAFIQFTKLASLLRTDLQSALFEYYLAVLYSYREAYDPDYVDIEVPILGKESDIWHLLSSPALHIPYQSYDVWTVLLLFECSWDREHGLAVRIRNGIVDSVSNQGHFF